MASEASHITHEVLGEIRAGGSSLARPRADFLVIFVFFPDEVRLIPKFRCLFRRRCLELMGTLFQTDSEEEMIAHLRQIHMNWLPVLCGVCDSRFPTVDGLSSHFCSLHPQHNRPTVRDSSSLGSFHMKSTCFSIIIQ